MVGYNQLDWEWLRVFVCLSTIKKVLKFSVLQALTFMLLDDWLNNFIQASPPPLKNKGSIFI